MELPYSVLMPLAPWEEPAVVAEALASLGGQTLPAAEVLVSCDGEPPPLLRQVLMGANLPLRILVGPGGEGVGPVLARGLQACRHELVVRADADDICLPSRCERQLMALAAQPQVSALSSAIAEFADPGGMVTGVRRVPANPAAIAALSRWRNPLNHPAVVLRRSHVLGVGNYRSRRGFEDYDLWLRLLTDRGPEALANLDQVLLRVRVGPSHLARRHGWSYLRLEARFLLACGWEGLLPWHRVLVLLLARLPLRLLPRRFLQGMMDMLRARPGIHELDSDSSPWV